MNKYTLSFISEELEQKYQIDRYSFTIPIFKGINILGFLVCTLRSILSIIFEEYFTFYLFLSFAIVVITTYFVILYYKKQWVNGYLIIMNHILMLYQYTVNEGYDYQEAYLFGQMMMTLHFLIIIICDFKYAIIQLFNNLLIKILIAEFSNGKISLQTYLYTFIIAFMALFVIQRTNKQFRQSFLFTINDNSQGSFIIINRLSEYIFPTLQENPFVLFTFNNDQLQFQIRMTNFNNFVNFSQFKNNQTNLIAFLRKYLIYGKTLEDFIFCRINQNQKQYITNKTLELTSSEKGSDRIIIKYSEIFITELMFIIVVDQQKLKIQSLVNRLQKLEGSMQQFSKSVNKFFIKQLNILQKSYHNQRNLYKMETQIVYFVSQFTLLKEINFQNFNLMHQIKHYIRLFQLAYNVKIVCQYPIEENIPIITSKQMIKYLLIQIFMSLSKLKDNKIILSIYNENQYINIVINIQTISTFQIEFVKKKSIRKILQTIGPFDKLQIAEKKIIICLYQNMEELNNLEQFSFLINQ